MATLNVRSLRVFGGPELLVRPFTSVSSEPVLRPRQPPQEVTPIAFIRWGKAATFNLDTFRDDVKKFIQVRVNDDDEPERDRYNYQEEGRRTIDFKVLGVDDPSSYVVVRATKTIGFNGPDGAQFLLKMNPTQPGTNEGSGQTPPAPPDLDEI